MFVCDIILSFGNIAGVDYFFNANVMCLDLFVFLDFNITLFKRNLKYP